MTDKQRTDQQNKALHVFCEMLADALNNSGKGMKAVFAVKEVEVPWSKDTVKECLWRPIQLAMQGKKSTTEANTTDYSEVHQVLCQVLGEKLHVEVPAWPDRFGGMNDGR